MNQMFEDNLDIFKPTLLACGWETKAPRGEEWFDQATKLIHGIDIESYAICESSFSDLWVLSNILPGCQKFPRSLSWKFHELLTQELILPSQMALLARMGCHNPIFFFFRLQIYTMSTIQILKSEKGLAFHYRIRWLMFTIWDFSQIFSCLGK